MSLWYCRSLKGEYGPLSTDEILFLMQTGKLPDDTLVKADKEVAWLPLSESTLVRRPSRAATRTATEPTAAVGIPAAPAATPSGVQRAVGTASRVARPPQLNVPGPRTALRAEYGVALALVLIAIFLIFAFAQNPPLASPGRASTSDAAGTPAGAGPHQAPHQLKGQDAITVEEKQLPLLSPETPEVAASEITPQQSAESPPPSNPSDDTSQKPVEPPQQERTPNPRFQVGFPTVVEQPSAAPAPTMGAGVVGLRGSNLKGRSTAEKADAIRNFGGSVESERAVSLALQWLRKIQERDGSWSFQHVGPEATPGNLRSRLAATAMAVLCFLGAGNTTKTGTDAKTVLRAIEFLQREVDSPTYQTNETMYVVALLMMTFSELSAMEPSEVRAKEIARSLQAFIENSQDKTGGGWRYNPGDPGDLSVTGWQIMALQSGKTCGLDILPQTVTRSSHFLDSVSFASGAAYSYAPTMEPTLCMSAVGLLSRVYLGWQQDRLPLQQGIERISEIGPDPNDVYFNYYASLVLHHYGGRPWEQWNSRMQPMLVSDQIRIGPAAGSWPLRDPFGVAGGQIYQTCLSTLCLEVYYRYLPIFSQGTP